VSVLPSREFYDAVAPGYGQMAEARRPYLDAVDDLVIRAVRDRRPATHLDVGCGDGRRTLRIAGALEVGDVLGIDESAGMLALARQRGLTVHHGTVLDYHGGPFGLVTCLWNTLGHVPAAERQATLACIAGLLSPRGMLFLDVNNRYNARAYGLRRVAGNMWRDATGAPSGDVVARAVAEEGRPVATGGHVFAPMEVDRLLAAVPQLAIRQKTYVDYASGRVAPSRFQGQILYRIERTV
jgi:SAM-dependent methyltransferase